MDKLESLENLCHSEGIILEYATLKHGILGFYFKDKATPHIVAINKTILNDKMKHIEVLAEELGHYFTTSGNFTGRLLHYRDRLDLNKCEMKAIRWACNYLIRDEDVLELASQTSDYHEMSEALGVPYNLLIQKINFMNLNT
ncbi:MAG: ImmA/IrrE family metallo-endopeptidase [Peptostreptococcaceae bacterium]